MTEDEINLRSKPIKELHMIFYNDPIIRNDTPKEREQNAFINIEGMRLRSKSSGSPFSREKCFRLPYQERKRRRKEYNEMANVILKLAYIENWQFQEYVERCDAIYDHVMCTHN